MAHLRLVRDQGAPPARGGFRLPRGARTALILAAATVPYLRATRFPFVYDDQWTIQENAFIREPANLGRLVRGQAGDVPDAQRPVFVADEIADHAAFGLRPGPWHAESIAWHGAASLLAAHVAESWLGAPGLAAGLLWALHPSHVEAVSAVNYREDLLVATFLLATLAAIGRRRATGRRRWWAAAAIGYALALGSKESALVLPLLLPAIDLLRPGDPDRVAMLRRNLGDYVLVAALALAAVAASGAILGDTAPQSLIAAADPRPFSHSVFVAGWQLVRTVLPVDISPEHTMPALGRGGWRAMLALLGLAACAWRGPRHLLAWGLLALLPTLPLLPLHNPIADRHLLLPSLAGCAALALLARRIDAWARGRPAPPSLAKAPPLVLLPIVVFAALTWREIPVWSSERALWSAAARRAPQSARAQLGLARALHAELRFREAAAFIDRAIRLEPGNGDARMTRAIASGSRGDFAGALADLDDARRLGVTQPARLASNRGYVLFELGHLDEALGELDEALRLSPGLDRARAIRQRVVEAIARRLSP